jgi:alpha-L-fucosidase
MQRLQALGNWMQTNGEAIYDTQPWQTFGGETKSGKPIRYTQKDGKLYIHFFSSPGQRETIPGLLPGKNTAIRLLSGNASLKWKNRDADMEISFPDDMAGAHVWVIELSELPRLVLP